MKGKIMAILIPILILAFPNAIENICNKAANIFMMIITPAFEYIAQILQ